MHSSTPYSGQPHFVAEALNALPALLDLIERLTTAPAGEDADAEVERILAMSDEQILAEADACDLDWARGVKLGIKIGKGITAPSPVARVPAITVKKIETVTGDYMIDPGEPFWRIEINGYCADFDYEQAAENFASAIRALFTASPSDGSGEGK